MRFLQGAVPCEPAKALGLEIGKIFPVIAARFTFARKRSAASSSLTQRQEAALNSKWMGSALVGMWIFALLWRGSSRSSLAHALRGFCSRCHPEHRFFRGVS